MRNRFEITAYFILITAGLVVSGLLQESRVSPVPELTAPEPAPAPTPSPPSAPEGSRESHLGRGYRLITPEKPQEGRHRLVSLGTAFAINGTGDWATARHVSRDCAAIIVLSADHRRGFAVKAVIDHPDTDLSVLVTGGNFDKLTIAARDPGHDETAFMIGFPQGNPASVEASYLGSGIVNVTDGDLPGARADRITGDFWVEDRRVPSFDGTLGGLSGGPVLDGSGSVLGVTVAEEPRRGRVVSIAPHYLTELLTGAASVGWIARDNSALRDNSIVTNANFGRYGDQLREENRVAEVFCYGYRDGVQTRRPRL